MKGRSTRALYLTDDRKYVGCVASFVRFRRIERMRLLQQSPLVVV
jgi:hypothetical protein